MTTPLVHDAPVTDLTLLRKPFPDGLIGKLPRVTCPDCSDRRKTCSEHLKAKCAGCGNYISVRHIHIDYVGHADVTNRLLDADPAWDWAPLAADERGLPVFDLDSSGSPVGLWIRLTVGGVSRLGYGSVPSGQNDAVKVLIGDALRNAAMRFGVALDLWAKGDRADPTAENPVASAGEAVRGTRPARPAASPARTRAAKQEQEEELLPKITRLIGGASTIEELRAVWQLALNGALLDATAPLEDGETIRVRDWLEQRGKELDPPFRGGTVSAGAAAGPDLAGAR
jgi:hypothetical protein